ncbi:MAG: argininosuccinate synthase [Deltaproteobacteria bacterium]|nr:argininosuccinate synthase [Deltaproteobacteria bacterium]
MKHSKIVVAFSGGLDTSYLAAWLKETTSASVVTVTVDTGGFPPEELEAIEARSKQVGADRHYTIDARQETFDRVVKTLIQGNVLRNNTYPLCVSAERVTQAEVMVRAAQEMGATAIAHGSTGAGNDQVRFDVAIRTLAPDMEIITPIRDLGLSRDEETAWLRERDIDVLDKTSTYSVNAGMWGVTIGGGETHDPWTAIPNAAYPTVVKPEDAPVDGVTFMLAFEKGTPVAIDGKTFSGPGIIEYLNTLGAMHGVGRGVHLGDTILGIKGRIAFEAPAATILVSTHRELEKLVLTRWQQFMKDKVADFFGLLLHEALFYDPVAQDIEAMIVSSQSRVTGDVRVTLKRGLLTVDGVKSDYSLMAAANATYGETQSMWDGRDAEGFTKIYGLQGRLAALAGRQNKSE